jgi:inward rectifier potassium channel
VESLVGVLGFAVATGLLFGRVSRPSAKIGFSEKMLVVPYQDMQSLQFRVVNRRRNDLVEIEARVMLMTVDEKDGQPIRSYRLLRLERDKVLFLPLTWTIVHPIDSESPMFGLAARDLERLQAEVMILIKAYDDTFSQTVMARYSYRYDEIGWNQQFAPAFSIGADGDLVLELQKVGNMSDSNT